MTTLAGREGLSPLARGVLRYLREEKRSAHTRPGEVCNVFDAEHETTIAAMDTLVERGLAVRAGGYIRAVSGNNRAGKAALVNNAEMDRRVVAVADAAGIARSEISVTEDGKALVDEALHTGELLSASDIAARTGLSVFVAKALCDRLVREGVVDYLPGDDVYYAVLI